MSHNNCSDNVTNRKVMSETTTGQCANCGQPATSKYCGTACFRVWQRSGDRDARFWAKVKIGAPNECWPWQASVIGAHGYKYGQFSLPRGADGKPRTIYAHRYVCELTHGPIPSGLVAMHSCDNTVCCNPRHIKPGTQGDNLRDASAKGHFKCPRPTAHKVNTEDLADIDALLKAGERQIRIAEKYGVTRAWVCQYAKGQRRLYDRPSARLVRRSA